jgi:hypothetical protein
MTHTTTMIFCDGQVLASAGDLAACADELSLYFDLHLDVDLDVDVDCDGDSCEGEGEGDVKVGCLASVDRPGPSGLHWAALLMLGIGGWRIRRARRR